MIAPTEFEDLFKKIVSGGAESISAYKEYCQQRCQSTPPQVEIDNRFLNFLATQATIDHCPSEVLCLAARIYSQKDGYPKPSKFIELLEQASTQSLPNLHLAYLLLPPEVHKEHILRNIRLQSQSLAVENNATAQSILGFLYATGRGVPAEELPHKDTLAVTWLRKAAEQGDARAQSNLGVMYGDGRGIPEEEWPQKDTLSVAWLRKAAEQGNAGAQCNLGVMYEAGRGITPEEWSQKDTLSVVWLRKAAEQGDAGAQFYLGFMYETGRGILGAEKRDKKVMAYVWYTKSAAQNNQKAKACLSKLNISSHQKKKAEMMLTRSLSYRQVKCLFNERRLKRLLLISLILQNKANNANPQSKIVSLPTDLLFQIARQLAPLSHVPLSELEIPDMFNRFIIPFRDGLTFKILYRRAANNLAFFKENPATKVDKDSSVAKKVNSGELLLLSEIEKYAKEKPDSFEANVYKQLVVNNSL